MYEIVSRTQHAARHSTAQHRTIPSAMYMLEQCVCYLHGKAFFLPNGISTPRVRADSSSQIQILWSQTAKQSKPNSRNSAV